MPGTGTVKENDQGIFLCRIKPFRIRNQIFDGLKLTFGNHSDAPSLFQQPKDTVFDIRHALDGGVTAVFVNVVKGHRGYAGFLTDLQETVGDLGLQFGVDQAVDVRLGEGKWICKRRP